MQSVNPIQWNVCSFRFLSWQELSFLLSKTCQQSSNTLLSCLFLSFFSWLQYIVLENISLSPLYWLLFLCLFFPLLLIHCYYLHLHLLLPYICTHCYYCKYYGCCYNSCVCMLVLLPWSISDAFVNSSQKPKVPLSLSPGLAMFH